MSFLRVVVLVKKSRLVWDRTSTEKAVELVVTSVGVAASKEILSSRWNFWRSTEKAVRWL